MEQTGEVTDVLPQSEQQEPMSSEETLVNSDSEEEEESGSDIDDYSLERQAQRATLARVRFTLAQSFLGLIQGTVERDRVHGTERIADIECGARNPLGP